MNDLVRYEEVVGQLRIYPPDAGPMAPYIGSGMVVWRNAKEAEIRGLRSEMTRKHWRALADLLRAKGIERIYAKRGPGHMLPFSRPANDDWQVVELVDIRRDPPATGFADLPP